MIGSEARPLVAGDGVGPGHRLLAVVPVQPPGAARRHGAVRRRGRQHPAVRVAHGDADGQRTLPQRGLRPCRLLPQPAGGGLGQQPHPGGQPEAPRRPPRVLRHQGRVQRLLGQLLLLWRTREKCKMPLRQMIVRTYYVDGGSS
jgi:hypothetical protein